MLHYWKIVLYFLIIAFNVVKLQNFDFDNDKIIDFYAGGNFYRLKPEIGKHDGLHGGYFKGLGKGKFKYVSDVYSGIQTKGEVRDAI